MFKKRSAESIYILFSWVVYPSWSCGRVSLPWSAPTSWKRQQRATPCSQHPSTLDQSSINSFLDSGTGMTNGKWTFLGFETHHDACSDGDTSTAVRVGHNVSVADAQERDGDEPHGVEQVGVLLVVISFLIKKRLCVYELMKRVCVGGLLYLSHWRSVQLAMIHRETIKTRRTVPGHIVINVLSTNRVLKLIRFRAPIDRDEASVNSLLDVKQEEFSLLYRMLCYSKLFQGYWEHFRSLNNN